MLDRPVRKTLIADLDNCAFTLNQEVNGKLLSRQFIAHVKKQKYAEFYVCTHRTASNFKTHLLGPIKVLEKNIADIEACENPAQMRREYRYAGIPYFTEEHLSHVFTHKIVEHLEQETGLSCVAVSTPGDADQCGATYSQILKPLEEAAINQGYNFTDFNNEEAVEFDEYSKNRQLMQIINDALAKHPDEQHVFDFVDDRMDLCLAALELSGTLPKNVVLNVFHHDAFDATPLKPLNNIPKTQNNYCNFFTKVAAITTGVAVAAYVATQSFRA